MSRQSSLNTTQSIEKAEEVDQAKSWMNGSGQDHVSHKIQQDFQQKMDLNELLNCTRCGFCQPSCPTFVQTEGKEASSPRGRIALMKAVVDGVLEPDEHFERELSLCLGCRACETACPSGVNYGQLLEQARAIIHEHKTYSWPVRMFRSIFFKRVLPSSAVLKIVGTFLWIYQRSGLQWLVQKTRLLHVILPKNLISMERIIPEISSPKQLWKREPEWRRGEGVAGGTDDLGKHDKPVGQQVHAGLDKQNGQQHHAVQFFKGCIMDMMFHQTNQRTVQLAQRAGFDVQLPQAQTCCGALHAHAGDVQTSIELAKKNIIAFEQAEQAAVNRSRPNQNQRSTEANTATLQILTNAGGCGAFLKEYPHLLKDEPEWKERAEQFAAKIVDISEWLIQNSEHYHSDTSKDNRASVNTSKANSTDLQQQPADKQGNGSAEVPTATHANSGTAHTTVDTQSEVITYQDSCHLRHGMKVDKAPRQLLRQTEGVQFAELKNAHMCCGSAGIYNIVEQEMSMKVLDHKMEEVKKTQAKTIVTSNPGCLLQMQLGIQREGLGDRMKAVHLVDFLYEKEMAAHNAEKA